MRATSRKVDTELHHSLQLEDRPLPTSSHLHSPISPVPSPQPHLHKGGPAAMSDRYSSLIRTPVGQLLAKNLGLPNPVPLERWTEGAPLVDGTVVLGGAGRLEKSLVAALDDLGVAHLTGAGPVAEGEQKYKGLVFDATGITSSDQLVA